MQNWFWSLAVGARASVLRDAPDAGGPGGPTDGGVVTDAGHSAGGDGGDSTADTADVGRVPQAGDDGDDDSLDDDDAGFDQQYHDELKSRDPKAAKKYRNAINRSKAAAPLLTTLRQLGIDPKDRTAVAAFLRNGVTPKPANASAPPERAAAPARPEPERPKWQPLRHDEPFDEAPYRDWDLSIPANKTLYDGFKRTHEHGMKQNMLVNGFMTMADEIEKLTKRLESFEQGTQREKTEAKVKQWTGIVSEAAGKIKDPDLADSFKHAVAGEAGREKRAGREPDFKAITEKHLKRLLRTGQITTGEAARATAAAQGMADRNRSAPTRAAIAPGGAPAAPTRDRSNERIGDISKRLVGKSWIGASGR
jgi:hypothetical protein